MQPPFYNSIEEYKGRLDNKPCLMVRYIMSRLNIDQLAKEIRKLNRHQILYRVLKKELSLLGYWKNRKRGDPAKGYQSRGK